MDAKSASRASEERDGALPVRRVYPVGHRLKPSGKRNILKAILQYLKTHGERMDSEIAEATGLPLAKARAQLAELAARREIMVCHSTRYENGKPIESMKCRLAGYIPPAAPGRKSKSQLKLS